MRNTLLLITVVAIAVGCAGLVVDPSPTASASGDVTLAILGCQGPLYSGFGVCRVKEGTQIEASWQAVLPKPKGEILGGEMIVRLRDIEKSYPIPASGIINVPLQDFYGHGTWQTGDTSIANATAKMRVKYTTGIEEDVLLEGQILIRVLAQGYDPLAIDSGYKAWGSKCKVQYSSAGRGAVTCD